MNRSTHKRLKRRRRRTQRGGMSFSEVSNWFQSKNPFKTSDTPALSLTERMKQGWSSFKFPWSSAAPESKAAQTTVASGSNPPPPVASGSKPPQVASASNPVRTVRIPLATQREKQLQTLAGAPNSSLAIAPTPQAAMGQPTGRAKLYATKTFLPNFERMGYTPEAKPAFNAFKEMIDNMPADISTADVGKYLQTEIDKYPDMSIKLGLYKTRFMTGLATGGRRRKTHRFKLLRPQKRRR